MPSERPNRDLLIQKAKEDPEGFVDLFLALWDRCAALEKRVAELERNSRNSSKPPSSDQANLGKPPKPKPKSLRSSSGKKPGGQPGHKGSTLELTEDPDRVIECKIETGQRCEKCGELLPVHGADHLHCQPEVRQVFELPAIRLEVTEYQAQRVICPLCREVTTAAFPEGVNAPAQYGPHLKATAIYLGNYQLIPYERLQELFADLFGCSLSQGTLANFVKAGGKRAASAVASIREHIKQSDTVHGDETGCRLHGKRHWLHVASTDLFTCYMIHARRGYEALKDFGLLDGFTGNLIHDFYSSYYRFTNCKHFQCAAHILRELTYLHEEMDQEWAGKMKELLLEAKALRDRENQRDEGQRRIIGNKTRDRIQDRYADIVLEGLAKNPEPEPRPGKRGKPARDKALNLLIRFEERYEEIMGFFEYENVPFDNNQAERDLRMMKAREKISGTFRSEAHTSAFCDIRSVISTLKKQGRNVMMGIAQMLSHPDQIFQKGP